MNSESSRTEGGHATEADIKSGLVVFFTVVKLTDLNERTALGFGGAG